MAGHDQRADGWTLTLRQQPVRIVEGEPQGGSTDRELANWR